MPRSAGSLWKKNSSPNRITPPTAAIIQNPTCHPVRETIAVANPSGDGRKDGAGEAPKDLGEDDGGDAPGEIGLQDDEDDGEGLADEIGGDPEHGAHPHHEPGVVVPLP